MSVILAITLGLILSVSPATSQNICIGYSNGAQIPNSFDCSTYYVCNHGEPILFRCRGTLLYDHRLGVCNWPDKVTCGQLIAHPKPPVVTMPTIQPTNNPVTSTAKPTPQFPMLPHYPGVDGTYDDGNQMGLPPNYHGVEGVPEMDQKPPSHPNPVTTSRPTTQITTLPPQTPNYPNYPQHPIHENGGEYYPGVMISPQNPSLYFCTNEGFYFVPHPKNCQQYFICENYRIHSHHCAPGVHWDYIFAQCDYAQKAFCFGHFSSIGLPVHNNVTNAPPPSTIGVTGPVAIGTIAPPTAPPPPPATTQPPTTQPPKTEPPTTEPLTTQPPTTLPPTTEPPTEAVVTEPIVECPGNQAFFAHPLNCHKYYICIGGIPISTSCPEKMAWDNELMQCSEEALTKCHYRNAEYVAISI